MKCFSPFFLSSKREKSTRSKQQINLFKEEKRSSTEKEEKKDQNIIIMKWSWKGAHKTIWKMNVCDFHQGIFIILNILQTEETIAIIIFIYSHVYSLCLEAFGINYHNIIWWNIHNQLKVRKRKKRNERKLEVEHWPTFLIIHLCISP